MTYSTVLALALLGSGLLTNCQKKDVAPSTDCTREAYIIGFDPCGGVGGEGFVIALTSPRDTVLTYNLPAGLYAFPPALYADSRSNFLFPEAVRRTYKLRLGFRPALASEQKDGPCPSNVLLAFFAPLVRDKQIIVTCARKE